MSVSKNFLLGKLPAFRNERVTIADKQQTMRDIVPTLLKAQTENEWLYDKIGIYFLGKTLEETCENLYKFCKENLKYSVETEKLQTVSVPQALLTYGKCDCKGYASFINGCLAAIGRTGKQKVVCYYYFASYEPDEKIPYHVYAVVDIPGEEPIWVDPTPGANRETPFWWIIKRVKNCNMLQQVVGKIKKGVGALEPHTQFYDSGATTLQSVPPLQQAQQDLAASVLLNTNQQATGETLAPPVTMTLAPPPVETTSAVADNVATIDQPAPFTLTNTQIAWGLGGLAALYLLTKKKSNSVGKKKKSMLPVVLGVGALGYWLYIRNQETAVPAVTTPVATPVSTTPVIPINTPVPSPYITPNAGTVTVARSYAAQADKDALDRTLPDLQSTFAVMTDAEIIAMYNYMFGYVLQNKNLYQYPGATGTYADGGWDTALYNQMVAIRTKYNLSI